MADDNTTPTPTPQSFLCMSLDGWEKIQAEIRGLRAEVDALKAPATPATPPSSSSSSSS